MRQNDFDGALLGNRPGDGERQVAIALPRPFFGHGTLPALLTDGGCEKAINPTSLSLSLPALSRLPNLHPT